MRDAVADPPAPSARNGAPSNDAPAVAERPEPWPIDRVAMAPPASRLKRRHSSPWSPERSRTILRYRLGVGTLAVLLIWSGSLIFALWAERSALEREIDTARADARTALHVLAELGIQRPAGAHAYRAHVPILVEDGLVQDVLFMRHPREPHLSARLTLFNADAAERPVALKVTLYDRLGLELGSGRPGPEYAHPLRPGELRPYQLDIPLSRGAEPQWFKVGVDADGTGPPTGG